MPQRDESELIRHGGSTSLNGELVYWCPDCNKPKLYANTRTKKWFCHVCGQGGRLKGTFLFGSATPFNPEKQTPSREGLTAHTPTPKEILGFLRLRIDDDLVDALPPLTDVQRSYFIPMGLKLFIYESGRVGCKVVGKQTNNFFHEPRYLIQGERGILWLNSKHTNPKSTAPRKYLLCEGMWDALHMWAVWKGCIDVFFTAGNNLTDNQVHSISNCVPYGETVWLALDNDKITPFLKIREALGAYGIRTEFLPPSSDYKDWDEFLTKDRKGAMAHLSGAFLRSGR